MNLTSLIEVMSIAWEEAKTWLVEAKAVPSGSPLLGPNATLVDLATLLQNGLVLCDLLNRYAPSCVGAVNRNPIHQVRAPCAVDVLVYVLSKHQQLSHGVHFAFWPARRRRV